MIQNGLKPRTRDKVDIRVYSLHPGEAKINIKVSYRLSEVRTYMCYDSVVFNMKYIC